MKVIHVHLHKKTKDANETKYIAKNDLKLPNGKIVQAGSVFYRKGSKFTPWFEKQGEGYNFNISLFKIENGDASYPEFNKAKQEKEAEARADAQKAIAEFKKSELAKAFKNKDGLEETINLTSVLNKFPSLRAYGLSSITYRSGEVYTVSTYDLPKEDLASLIAYVKSIKTVKDTKAPCGCK